MTKQKLALDFKSATLYTVRVVLHSNNTESLISALNTRMSEAGSFFENEPVVIDASELNESPEWPTLIEALKGHKLHPVGIQAHDKVLEQAVGAGLAEVDLSAPVSPDNPEPNPKAKAVQNPEPIHAEQTMMVNRQLRSGQRIYARNADLIVIGVVSQGAEVIADGNIHVYGPLRGKAMAGARGNSEARIFTTQLDAELLAVAGIYKVIENQLDPALRSSPAMVKLADGKLDIQPLKP